MIQFLPVEFDETQRDRRPLRRRKGTLPDPPVWYNNNENLNIRIWTIPVEDFFYSMLLLLSNIGLFETFKSSDKHVS